MSEYDDLKARLDKRVENALREQNHLTGQDCECKEAAAAIRVLEASVEIMRKENGMQHTKLVAAEAKRREDVRKCETVCRGNAERAEKAGARSIAQAHRIDAAVVVKYKDMVNYLTVDDQIALIELVKKVDAGRREAGKTPLECVCVESDWPEYFETWTAIAARVDDVAMYKARMQQFSDYEQRAASKEPDHD